MLLDDTVIQRGAIASTGGWDQFEAFTLGPVSLSPGVRTISVRNDKAEGPLMKLRGLRLMPVADRPGASDPAGDSRPRSVGDGG